ncbi:uncharacterized protein N7479_001992 [Penicillium vulpinum]|uniref:uncharacterized protein n=1 Tax=Penicillium vulpinum TaxID=29845 RepID=UPI00254808B6|nr:uncharacterized protein N7479_001992 [Penicillium vulpinum]KAJ5972074.1 hypothetical protein N7479_001992 [Penicillium vulpinum]
MKTITDIDSDPIAIDWPEDWTLTAFARFSCISQTNDGDLRPPLSWSPIASPLPALRPNVRPRYPTSHRTPCGLITISWTKATPNYTSAVVPHTSGANKVFSPVVLREVVLGAIRK